MRGFGAVTRRERQQADLFFADLIGRPTTARPLRSDLSGGRESFGETVTVDLGELTIDGVRIPISVADDGFDRAADLEAALRAALGGASRSFAIRAPLYSTGEARAFRWTPAITATAPRQLTPVVACEARVTDLAALVLARGTEVNVYVPAVRPPAGAAGPPQRRWVIIPGLADFYRLPDAVQRTHRGRWIAAIADAVPGVTRARLQPLSTPALRLMLAQNGAAAFAVRPVRRGTPRVDTGGVVNGVTIPAPAFPVREPHCYLPVISEREGRSESINAWDAGAGISLGPIQFNVQPPAGRNASTLFTFLWRLYIDDRPLFDQVFGALGWSMRFEPVALEPSDNDYFVLQVNAGLPTAISLRSLRADQKRNIRYVHTGSPDQTGFVPDFRRDLAARFRDAVVWPHVQEMIVNTSAVWLQPGLDQIRAAGIPALDPQNPDRDTFTLTAILLSAFVRFSGCLAPLLRGLRRWPAVPDKLAHWNDVLPTLNRPCPGLDERLRQQVTEARNVHDGLEAIRRARAGGVP